MERQKIIITNEVADKINGSARSVDEILNEVYADEIKRRREENPSAKNVSPVRMAIADAGLSGKSLIKDVITTSGAGEWLLPAYIDQRLSETVLDNETLGYLVTSTLPVDGLAVSAATLDLTKEPNKKNVQLMRVAEGADLPTAEIKIGERTIRLYKRGRAVEASYESIQYMRLDMFSKAIQAIGNSVAYFNVGEALETLVKGDGNNDPITTSLTTAAANVITPAEVTKAILNFNAANNGSASVTTIVAGDTFFPQLFQMFASTDQVRGVNGFAFTAPQFVNGAINLIYDARVPQVGGKDVIILLDRDFALTRYVANGSQVRELAKNIRNQTNLGTISEISGMAKFMDSAATAIVSK